MKFLLLTTLCLLFTKSLGLLDSGECGRDKTCFIERDFYRQFSFTQPGLSNIITIEMQAKASKWVSTSFSTDTFIGDDDVISCECEYTIENPENCSKIIAKDLRLNGRSNFVANEIDTSQNLCILEGEYTADGEIYCKIQKIITGNDSTDADLNKCFYQFYSAGNSNRKLERHVLYEPLLPPLRSTACIEVKQPIGTNIRTVQVSNCQYWKPHLGINVIAWMLFFPIAFFIWHFLVPTLGDDRRTWFIVHHLLLLISSFLAIIAFVFFLIYSGVSVPSLYRMLGLWISGYDIFLIYQIIGVLVLCLALVIPFVSIVKCSKYRNPNPRFAFDFIYFTLLVIAILLSSTYILIGLFILGDMHCYYNSFFDEFYPPARIAKYIMGGWLFCTSVIFFLFDIYHITDERTEKDKQIYQMAAMQDNKLLPDGSLASSTYPHSEGFYTPTDMPLRHSVFALFVIVCVIFTVALVTTIGLS